MKSWSAYSQEEIQQISSLLPVVNRYRELVGNSSIPKIKKIRHSAWLDCAFATFFKTSSTREIVEFWSGFTRDFLIELAHQHDLISQEVGLFALGKLGSDELNLSSDIDLIWISEKPASSQLIKKIQKFTQEISQVDEFGFCFRVDYDLRPGGRMGPLVSSQSQIEDYYWSQGETWERVALLRFSPIFAPENMQANITQLVEKFCFRKYADYNLLENLQQQRGKIRSFYNFDPQEKKDSFHLKLSPGGIRDIELFLHINLILHGGKDTSLRSKSTEDIARNLLKKNLLSKDVATGLVDSYWQLRHMEHLVQIENDQQTHSINEKNKSRVEKSSIKYEELLSLSSRVNDTVFQLLGEVTRIEDELPETLPEQQRLLKQLNFSEEIIQTTWPKIIKLTAQSANPSRDESYRQKVLYRYLHHLSQTNADRNRGLYLFEEFIRTTRAKASFFAFLLKQDQLLKDLAFLFSTSPHLGQLIASRPEILDSYVFQNTAPLSMDENTAYDQMAESKQLAELIHCHKFLMDKKVEPFVKSISDLADKITDHLLKLLGQKFGADHIDILCLGKWGGQEVGVHSDLDLVFVTEDKPTTDDFRLAKRFIARLTDVQRGGAMYDVDLRLRPSGQAGPLITSSEGLKKFLQQKAPAWQRQSYLRARSFQGNKNNELVRKHSLTRKLTKDEIAELNRILRELLVDTDDRLGIDLKYSPGGLLHMEFVVQRYFLFHQLVPETANALEQIQQISDHSNASEWLKLKDDYLYFRTIEQLLQLHGQRSQTKLVWDSDMAKRLASSFDMGAEELQSHLVKIRSRNLQRANGLDPLGFSLHR